MCFLVNLKRMWGSTQSATLGNILTCYGGWSKFINCMVDVAPILFGMENKGGHGSAFI